MKSLEELRRTLPQIGIPAYRANQIIHAVYKEGKNSYEEITVIPGNLKTQLSSLIPVFSVQPVDEKVSKNEDTIKVLFQLKDEERIEAVLMRFKDGRNTVCISCQVGCPMNCLFCATGKAGFKRNLTYEEITDQALYFEQQMLKKGERVDHVVFMGMGEPMLNYEEVSKAIKIFNDPTAFNIGFRHLTVSTSGIIPGIKALTKDFPQINLAVSLHAANDTLRKKIMPVAKTYPLNDLMSACDEYTQTTHRRITYEYIMLKDINDSDSDAGELAKLLDGQLCHVNLIPFNETNSKGLRASTKQRIDTFFKILEINHIPVTVRVSMGKDIDAACGQLAGKYKKK
jgi:23S rRNA (adenine2503-C2)-methyltransferase